MARKANHISIIQFDERTIWWLRVAPGARGVHVLDYAVEHGEWAADDGSLEKALVDFVDSRNIRGDTVYTVLRRHDMTARLLTLPSQDPEEIDGMVRLSAEDYVPYSLDELVVDQCLLEKLGDGRSRVLAVFAHRDVVDRHVDLLRQAGIEPQAIYFSTACMASAIAVARPEEGKHYAVINLASGGLEALVFNGARLEYTRGIATIQDWNLETEAANEVIDELATEVRNSMAAYRRESEHGMNPEAVYLCSDWADVRQACAMLMDEIDIECSPAWFARDLVTRGDDLMPALSLTALGAVLTAQGRSTAKIDLIPGNITLRRQKSRFRRKILYAAVMIALIGLSFTAVYYQTVRQRMSLIRDLERQIAEIEPEARGVVEKQRQLRILQQQVTQEGTFLELLAAVCDLAPPSGLNITRVSFRYGDRMDIYGRTEDLAAVDRLAEALRDLGKSSIPQFVNAARGYQKDVVERGEKIYAYSIEIPFPKNDESEGED